MKRALTILLVIAGVLVALVLLLAMSPVGWRIATGLLEGAVAGRSGLDLQIESLRGNLLSDISITSARLSVPGGPTILEIASVEASYDLPALIGGRVVVPELRASNARVLFEVGPDGTLTGWSRFATPPADTAAPGKPWPIDVGLALTDWAIVLRDSAAGYDARLSGLDVEAAGGPGDFRATLAGSLSVVAAGLSRPLVGSLSAEVAGSEREVRIERLDLPSGVGALAVNGKVSLEGPAPALDLTVRSSIDLATASSLATRGTDRPGPEVGGEIEITGALEGPIDAVRYRANLVGRGLTVGRVESPRVEVDLSGDVTRLDVDRFALDLFGGRATGSATVGLAGLHDDPRRVPYEASLNLTRLDLARLGPLLPEGTVGLGGLASGRARLRAASFDPGDLDGSFEVAVDGLAVGDTLLGELAVEGTIAKGVLEAAGRCCASVITVEAPMEAHGAGAVTFTADVSDLSVPAGIYGVRELAGSAAVEGSISFGAEGPSLSATASVPELTYRGLEIGPASIEATGRDTAYALSFRAFDDVVQGEGAFDTAGRYRVSAHVDSFDLASLMDETLRRRLDFEGAVTAVVSVRGSRNRPPGVEGTVLDLAASARGERAHLTSPFQFEAAPDTVHISWAAIEGTFGSITVTGGMSVRQSGEILARLDGIDLEAIANVVPDGLPAPLKGTADGDVRLFGRRDRPSFAAEITVQDFAYGGLGLRTAALEAMNDSTDVLFDLRAESAVAGSVTAYGSIPILPDSLRVMRPDRTREFGASIVLADFTLDAGPSLLPGIRGTKRFGADGAILLAGRADSLGSIYGRGSFGSVFARFDLIEFDLADTLAFEIGGGDIELARTTINVTPLRTLGKEKGGAVVLSGVVRSDGGMDLSAGTQGLDVGQLVRAFGPEPSTSVTGRLDFSADVAGTVGDPTVDFTWRLRRPSFSDYGFDEFSGRGGLAGGMVSIEEGVLSADGRTVTVTGVIPVAVPEETGEAEAPAREMDVRVSAGDFRLSGLTKLPPGIDSLDGRLYCDLALRGPLASPVLSGSAILRSGSLRGFDLKEPVRDIGFELHAGDGAVLLTNAHARLGGGSVEASGAAELRPGEAATFRLKVDLKSPEVAVEDAFDARVRGRLTWAGSSAASALSGDVVVEKLDVTYDVGLVDILTRRPGAIVIRRANEPASRIALDVAVDIEDEVDVKNSLVRLALRGGLEVRGTALEPRVTGRLDAVEGGTFKYRDNTFTIESLEVVFMDPSRRDPYVHLVGTATVTDRSEEEYVVTIVFDGFARETLPQLSSEPPLTQGDIISLLTFGDTFGGLAAGPQEAGSSADRFSQLARGAFISSLFGVAESTLEKILRLDTVSVDEEAVAANGLVGADVTIGKVFGDRLRVNYTTAVGEFADQEVEVSFRLSKQISIETRADPEGNHGIGLRLRIPFK